MDDIRAKQLKESLVASGIDSQLVRCYGGYEDLPLRWAEVIPIWYLQKYITNGLCIVYSHIVQSSVDCWYLTG